MSPVKLDYGRYVSNKLWNLFRLYANYSQDVDSISYTTKSPLKLVDRYILSKCEVVAREMEKSLDEFDVETACLTSVDFLLNSVCDLYLLLSAIISSFVEYAKPDLKGELSNKVHTLDVFRVVLFHVLNQLHLFLPHETEEINSQLTDPFISLLQQRYFTVGNELRRDLVDTEAIQRVEVLIYSCNHN